MERQYKSTKSLLPEPEDSLELTLHQIARHRGIRIRRIDSTPGGLDQATIDDFFRSQHRLLHALNV